MKTPPSSHQDRAAEAASYADRLQADLVQISRMLEHYSGPPARLEGLRENSEHCARQLEAISNRLDALGQTADPASYTLSDAEHAAIDAARDLRDRLMDTLSDLQHSGRAARASET